MSARFRLLFWLLILAASVGGGSWFAVTFFPGQATYRIGVSVPDAGRLEPGAAVKRNGLTIGRLESLEDREGSARLWLAIGVRHFIGNQASIGVATSLAGTDFIRVRERLALHNGPGYSIDAGQVVTGTGPEEVGGLGRAVRDMQATAAASRLVSEAAARLVTDATLLSDIRASAASIREATAGAAAATRELRAIAANLDRLAAGYGASGPLGRELRASAQHVTALTADVAAVTSRVRDFTEDPRLTAAVEKVSAGAGAAVEAVNEAEGLWSRLSFGARSATLYDLDRAAFRSDVAAWATLDDSTRFILGFDTGTSSGLTAQTGRIFDGGALELRVGTLAGELGAGLDVRVGAATLSLDAYRIPDPIFRFTGRLAVSRTWNALLRLDDAAVASRFQLGAETLW